jgi:hypothetical protein
MALVLFCAGIVASAASADTWFTLGDYRDLRSREPATADLILMAMREAVFYGQESVGGPVICATPIPISGERLSALLEEEINNPTNVRGEEYADSDQVAFILMHKLKKEGACK